MVYNGNLKTATFETRLFGKKLMAMSKLFASDEQPLGHFGWFRYVYFLVF